MKQNFLALCGALAGGILGYLAFFWVAAQGYYGPVLPGGLLGLGAGISRTRSILVAASCGLMATALGLFTEWRFAPFIDDPGLVNFISNIQDLKPITLVMIALGGVIGFWVPFRRMESSTKRPQNPEETPR